MSSSKIKKTSSRKNFWTPLQLLDADKDDNVSGTVSDQDKKNKAESVSPIKVITENREIILNLINSANLSNYLVKRISLGLKIICGSVNLYQKIVEILRKNNCQFFTHEHKNNKPFKVVLRGLDYKTDVEVKNELTTHGLKCTAVKVVNRKFEKYVDTIYTVYFESGSVKLHELKKNVRTLFRTIITWDYHRKIKNKPVQCRRCQMFGHGEKGCNVTARCAKCAQGHITINCSADKIQCANCGENHPATDLACPTRLEYIKLKQNISSKINNYSQQSIKKPIQNEINFPYLNNRSFNPSNSEKTKNDNCVNSDSSYSKVVRGGSKQTGFWPNNNNRNRAESSQINHNVSLFSEEEFMELTMELISKLGSCKTKEQQFGVIAQLALKFLYSNVK